MLLQLKRARRLTARELAGELHVSLNAVRHHLKELEVEGLVEYERETRGVGAPAFVYRLTAAGEALFPRRYEQTLTEVLERVAEQAGRAAAVALVEAHFDALARRLSGETAGLPPAARMAAVARALADEGYMAEWEASSCCGTLTERNCAIQAVAERFPEVCAAELRLMERVIGGTVERRAHILAGCNACQYKVRFGEEWVDFAAAETAAARGHE